MDRKKGIFYTILSATSFALTPVFILKAYEQGASPWEMIFTQSIIASTILLLGLISFKPLELKLTKYEFLLLLPIGLVGALGTTICYNLSLKYISGAIATLLLYTYPLFVTLWAVLIWKQKFSLMQFTALFCSVIGVFLATQIIEIDGCTVCKEGLFLGITAALAYTLLNLLSEKALIKISSWKVTAYTQFGSTLGLIIILIIFPNLINLSKIKPIYWFYGSLIATICSIVPIFLLMKGIFFIGSSRAAIISTAEIPITIFLTFIFLGERFTFSQIIGSILIFLGVLFIRREGR